MPAPRRCGAAALPTALIRGSLVHHERLPSRQPIDPGACAFMPAGCMIDLGHLAYVVAAAEHRSFSRAAGRFNVKQSTLSQKVARLEDQLGFRLFERTTRGARPTRNAHLFLVEATELLARANRLEQRARACRSSERPSLSLAYSGDLFSRDTARILDALTSRHPDMCLQGYERQPARLFTELVAGQVDGVIAPLGHEDGRWNCRAFPICCEFLCAPASADNGRGLYWDAANTNPQLASLRQIMAETAAGQGPARRHFQRL